MWLACAVAPAAAATEMSATVPRGVPVAVFLAPGATDSAPAPAWSEVSVVASVLQHARMHGWVPSWDAETGMIVDGAGFLSLVARYPTAVVLTDVHATRLSGGGCRMSELRGGLVLDTDGDPAPVTRRVQDLLDLYTSKLHSTIARRESGAVVSFCLTDDRLPVWASVEWGAVDKYYVVALGDGVFDAIARAIQDPGASLRTDPWFAAADGACRGKDAILEVYVDLPRLRQQLAPMVETIDGVARGLRCGDLDRGLWAVGRQGRVVNASCVLRTPRGDRHIPLTRLPDQDPRAAAAIPPAATSCAIFDVRSGDLLLRGRDAYLAARSEPARQRLVRLWNERVGTGGWSWEPDLLSLLGDRVVIHNDPPHPLGLPLFCTILVEIEGSSQTVRASLDRLLGAARTYLEPAPPEGGGSRTGLRLRRAADGVWYLQWGLYGPALAVTDGWIVISFSPDAVRQNVRFLQTAAAPGTTRPGLP